MSSTNLLKGKRVLIVDDEPNVLESLIELLHMCRIDTATSFEAGKKLLENEPYDIAILDIMGVNGFELLKSANTHNVPALMLTANALNEKNLKKAAENGAVYFAPKDKMVERLGGFYDKRFHGTNWREKEKDFWGKKVKSKFLI